ncbi:PAQR family membrane homeostasis protein TrhA [Rubripirellula lacrimiformis]|uniref:PAQR family membrane homeostasis protein TrhA n=1 Tax=Rubripirellula lacrimiformis TaxID=1930273 RepID=UPI001C54DE2A|nr:hemolysin III family protein [Rubripirellula lacrimiformis]
MNESDTSPASVGANAKPSHSGSDQGDPAGRGSQGDSGLDPQRLESSGKRGQPAPPPPTQPDQEWANALTHGIATIVSLVAGVFLIRAAADVDVGMMIACAAYTASVVGTFLCSTLSHIVRRQPLLNTMRSWDQAFIYTMISGTYTPIVYQYASDGIRMWLLAAIWIAAATGFFLKVGVKHRVNSIGTVSYLLLGWLPALPLVGRVPAVLVTWMVIGGVLYTMGVALLINDHRVRYLHAGWHLFVMAAAASHWWVIWAYVI